MIMRQIPVQDNIKYIISQEVQISIEELTDDMMLKLNKPDLQIALKAMKSLYLKETSIADDLRALITNYDSMAMLLKKNGYIVSPPNQKDKHHE